MEKFKARKFKNARNECVTIRLADVQDARQILQHSKAVVAEDIYQILTLPELDLTVTSEENWIIAYSEHPDKLIIVAEVENQIVGLLDFNNGNRNRTSHIGEFGMSMAKAYRGTGIGTQMLHALIEWAESNTTIEKINLTVHSNNFFARSLYEKLGFVVEGTRKNEIKYEDGRYVDAVLMGRCV